MNEYTVLGKVIDTAFYIYKNGVEGSNQFVESFRPGQIKSKSWLVDEVCNYKIEWNNILVLGSWNSVLLWELFNQQAKVYNFDFVDIDPVCHMHRDIYFKLNKIDQNYNNIIMDATHYSDYEGYDLVINTSCEHMNDIPAVYGPMYALQSNNQNELPEHINCVESAKHLAEKNNLTRVVYTGEKDLGNKKRFMAIGTYY